MCRKERSNFSNWLPRIHNNHTWTKNGLSLTLWFYRNCLCSPFPRNSKCVYLNHLIFICKSFRTLIRRIFWGRIRATTRKRIFFFCQPRLLYVVRFLSSLLSLSKLHFICSIIRLEKSVIISGCRLLSKRQNNGQL